MAMNLETIAVHAGRTIDPSTGAIAQPLYLSTTFEREPDGSYPNGYLYTRLENPNRARLEECLTALEGGVDAAAFASGSAATLSVFQALAPGDHVVAPLDVYTGTPAILRTILEPWGLAVTFVDMTDVAAVERSLRPNTRLIWIETPSNPLLEITDIGKISALAHSIGAICVCDNTWATPMLQQPFRYGADLVVHSTTKYLGGHSDVLGGAVITREASALFHKIRAIQKIGGGVPSPFDCWLVHRGIQTLPCRMRVHSDTALQLAQWLSQHPQVEAVYYPGLPGHKGGAIAIQQMRAFGGMLSLQVRGGSDAAFAVAAKVKLFKRATSLGGVESLIEHRASIEGPASGTPQNLLRLSIGLEHVADLTADLKQALGE